MNDQSKKVTVYKSASPVRTGGHDIVIRGKSCSGPSILAECDPAELLAFCLRVVEMGNLVSFSATSDGGAICVCIKQDGTRFKAYPKDGNDCLVKFRDLLETIGG